MTDKQTQDPAQQVHRTPLRSPVPAFWHEGQCLMLPVSRPRCCRQPLLCLFPPALDLRLRLMVILMTTSRPPLGICHVRS